MRGGGDSGGSKRRELVIKTEKEKEKSVSKQQHSFLSLEFVPFGKRKKRTTSFHQKPGSATFPLPGFPQGSQTATKNFLPSRSMHLASFCGWMK